MLGGPPVVSQIASATAGTPRRCAQAVNTPPYRLSVCPMIKWQMCTCRAMSESRVGREGSSSGAGGELPKGKAWDSGRTGMHRGSRGRRGWERDAQREPRRQDRGHCSGT